MSTPENSSLTFKCIFGSATYCTQYLLNIFYWHQTSKQSLPQIPKVKVEVEGRWQRPLCLLGDPVCDTCLPPWVQSAALVLHHPGVLPQLPLALQQVSRALWKVRITCKIRRERGHFITGQCVARLEGLPCSLQAAEISSQLPKLEDLRGCKGFHQDLLPASGGGEKLWNA